PEHMTVHPSTLPDDGHLASLADEIRLERAATPPPRPSGDTIALVTADAEGFAVSLIQSLFWGFGSGICEPTTGIVAQNRGACFTLEPGHPNAFAPGKLPAHTLMPVVVHDERGLAAVAGSMGGYAQPQINAQTLLHLMGGASPAEAVAAPRWILERSEPSSPARIVIEAGVREEARRSLESLPYPATVVPDLSDELGHAQLIRVRSDGFDAGSDPRSDGGSLAG
ncbi:MAG: gamma-glutamyltranspeptidase, partial [Actinobacteria bacterium]